MSAWNIDAPVGWVAAAVTAVWLIGAVITIALKGDSDDRPPR